MADRAQETLERVERDPRRQWGWEPSPMASVEEQRAYQAYQMLPEVEAGRLPVSALPEEYGGRPTGTSRRAIRMQAEYDEAQSRALEQQRLAQQMEQERQRMTMLARDQQIQEEEAKWKKEAMLTTQDLRLRTNQHVSGFMSGLRGGVGPDGKEIPAVDPESPEYPKRIAELTRNFPLAVQNPEIQPIVSAMDSIYNARITADKDRVAAREEAQESFVKTTQSLLESGVPEEELPQYYDTSENVPAGTVRFDPMKVARKLGTTKAEERAEAKAAKEETPNEKIGLDLQQAYGELNSALMSGEDAAAAKSKVAGLRARYEAATGEEAPEVFPQPQNRQEYDRIPSGTTYIGKDGKTRVKQ